MADTSPLTILVPGDPDQLTGGYVYNQRIAAALRKAGRIVTVQGLAGQFPEADDEAVRAADEALSVLPEGSQVVMDGLALGGLPDLVSRHAQRLRILALVHHPLADETGLKPDQAHRLKAAETRALACVDGVITTSGFTARRLADFEVEAGCINVVEPGTAVAPVAVGSGAEPRLLCVASLIPRKGQDLLLHALSRLRGLSWHCDLVGSAGRDPAFAAIVRDLVRQLDLEGRVVLRGEQNAQQLGSFYHHADLFVLPSFYEGFGMVVTEALARGLPVVTTTGGALQYTLPERTGIKVAPGDVDALTDALRRVLCNPGDLQELRSGAQAARLELRSWDQAGAEFGAAVDRLAAQPGKAAHG